MGILSFLFSGKTTTFQRLRIGDSFKFVNGDDEEYLKTTKTHARKEFGYRSYPIKRNTKVQKN